MLGSDRPEADLRLQRERNRQHDPAGPLDRPVVKAHNDLVALVLDAHHRRLEADTPVDGSFESPASALGPPSKRSVRPVGAAPAASFTA